MGSGGEGIWRLGLGDRLALLLPLLLLLLPLLLLLLLPLLLLPLPPLPLLLLLLPLLLLPLPPLPLLLLLPPLLLLLLLALPAWVLAWVPGGVVPGDGVLAARERATSWVWASTGFVLLLCPVQLRFPSPSHTALAERATCGVVAALTSLPG